MTSLPETPELDQFLHEAVAQGQLPCVTAIVADRSRVLYHRAFGKVESGASEQMPPDALFRIASMTKPVTSVMVLALYEQGQIDLDDPIAQYLPDLKDPQVIEQVNPADATYTTRPALREITLRHLLTHTAGFGYAFSNANARLLEERANKPTDQPPLLHDPGERWTYGPSTRILGRLLSQITGQPLEELYQSQVFGPLGMPDTSYLVPGAKHQRVATCHFRRAQGMVEEPRPESFPTGGAGDSGVFSTAPDYIRFAQMLLNRGTLEGVRILGEDTVNLMTQNHIGELVVPEQPGANPSLSETFPLGAGRDKFGLGFQIAAAAEEEAGKAGKEGGNHRRSVGSYGWSGLYNTHFWCDPARGLGVIFLSQLLPFYDTPTMRALQGFEELVYRHLG
jgi:CubicO group peptidase (beta-lactamase class C family)